MKKFILAIMLTLAMFMTGCFNSNQADNKSGSIAQILTEQDAQQAVSMVKSMHIDAISQATTSSVTSQAGMQATTTDYPVAYSIHRDCNISGTADTVGEKLSDTDYNATNTFEACQHTPGIEVNGQNHVYAKLQGDELFAELTDNEIIVTMGELNIDINSNILFHSNRDFSLVDITLDGNTTLTEGSNTYLATFHDFNITQNTTDVTMQMNGSVDIFACGKEYFDIQTLEPITTASNGTFTAGKLKINGAIFQYNNNKTVSVTLTNGDTYTIPQGMDMICNLDSGSILIGSIRDAVTLNFLNDVNVSATVGSGDSLGIYTSHSDANGNFKLTDLSPGDYTLLFEKNGYIPASAQFTVGENVQENFGLIDLLPDTVSEANVTFSGAVKNAQSGDKVADVTIVIHAGHNDPNGNIIVTTTSDANGNFSVDLPTGNYTVEISKNGFTTSSSTSISLTDNLYQELTIVPIITANQAIITLSWGENPSDLDSHLQKQNEYEIYYGHTSVSLASGETASLDIDDTSGYGPETISLDNLDANATYTYFVYHYRGSQSIATSSAIVTVTFGSTTYDLRPPNQSGRTWTVFNIENGVLVPCTGTCIQ